MKYRFTVTHVPGKNNVVPDTFSRRADSPISSTPQSVVTAAYSDELGPPAWISPPVVGSLTTDQEELLQGNIIASLAFINVDQSNIVSWQRLEAACLADQAYKILHQTISTGAPDTRDRWDQAIQDFFPHRHSLITVGPVVMLHDRPVIPQSLRKTIMDHLHAGHGSASSMFERASTSLYWPNFRTDLINHRAACLECSRYAPSNPNLPPTPPEEPNYPFQSICADFFSVGQHNYLVVVDRYSNWMSLFKPKLDNTELVIYYLRQYMTMFGIPVTITTDGAKVFTSKLFETFCQRWGIIHRVSMAYNPQANKRAELGVKHAKRIIRGNVSQTGSLDTDKLVRAVLMHRNTPGTDTGLSPAQIVFGRQMRDPLPFQPGKFLPKQEWRLAAKAREEALAQTRARTQEKMAQGSRELHPLVPGDHVYVQNQHGNNPKRWDKTGIVLEAGPYHSYTVMINGSRQATKRNRKFLRKYVPQVPAPQPAQVSRPSPTPRPAPVRGPAPPPVNLDPEHRALAHTAQPRPGLPGIRQSSIPQATSPKSDQQWSGAQPAPYPNFHSLWSLPPQNAVMAFMLPYTWPPNYQAQDSMNGGGTSEKFPPIMAIFTSSERKN